MEEETNLTDEIKKLNNNIEAIIKSGKVKGLKIPKSPSKSQVKKGYVHYFYIRENGEIEPMRLKIDEGTTSIEGSPRLATNNYMLSYKGKPAIIQSALSSEPYIHKKELDAASRDKMLATGYRLLANRVEMGQIKAKTKISGGLIFFGVIALIVVGYLLLK